MNAYNENLQQTVVKTLAALSLAKANLSSVKTSAEITLYQAQGAEITAREKLKSTQINQAIWRGINDQAHYNNCQVVNLLASAAEANTDVASSVTNAATAAANVQIAANAIATLAADIGGVLSIATASLSESNLCSRIVHANSFINEVANDSRRIAMDAMNTSAFTSEITTTEVLAQTQAVKSKFDNILKSTQTTLENFANLAITKRAAINQTSQAERLAEGGLEDAARELRAAVQSYQNANNRLNHGLSVTVISSQEVQISFAALSNPLPTFESSQAVSITIPSADPKYFLALLPAQNQSTFALDQAQQIFAQNHEYFTSLSVPAVNMAIRLSTDVYGNPINAGSSYVAYLYIELSQSYKQYISNFSDVLSAPSQLFVPASLLPVPTGLQYSYKTDPASGENWAIATLQMAAQNQGTAEESPKGAFEYRCILIQRSLNPAFGFLLCKEENNNPPLYFNLKLAENVSPASYTLSKGGTAFTFAPGTKDNFGNVIKKGVEYQAYVLVVAVGDAPKQFVNALAGPFPSFVVWQF